MVFVFQSNDVVMLFMYSHAIRNPKHIIMGKYEFDKNGSCTIATRVCRKCHHQLGCRWCSAGWDGRPLGSNSYCADRQECYFGMVGHPGPYGGKSTNWSLLTSVSSKERSFAYFKC